MHRLGRSHRSHLAIPMSYRRPPHPWDHDRYWDPSHPFRFRTWLRPRLPWVLIRFLAHPADCEASGGWHRWYNMDGSQSGCYHCSVVGKGRLWKRKA